MVIIIIKNLFIVVFCSKHNITHTTTFINYIRANSGMPCCANKKKSEKLTNRTFSEKTVDKMKQSAKTRLKRIDICCKNKKYWRRTLEYRVWVKKVKHNWNNKCGITGKTQNLLCHHFYSFNKNACLYKQNLLRFDPENGILICKHLHVLFHNRFGYTENTLEQFLVFLTSLIHNTKSISSQANWEQLEGSETRVYDPERIMELHERLASIKFEKFK